MVLWITLLLFWLVDLYTLSGQWWLERLIRIPEPDSG